MGKTLLMIHGVGCTGEVWDPMRPALEAGGHVCEAITLFPELRTKDNPPAQISDLTLNAYVEAASKEAARLTARDGQKPVALGHSMGGLIAQKLVERGDVAGGIFLTPAQPADCQAPALSLLFTFANVVFAPRKTARERAFKVWKTGFRWGVLNQVPPAQHDAIYEGAVYDSGRVYGDLGEPESDPHRTCFVDESRFAVPTLTVCGTQDRACPPKAVRRMRDKYAKAPVPGEFREYSDLAHWVFAEPIRDQVSSDIMAWLAARM